MRSQVTGLLGAATAAAVALFGCMVVPTGAALPHYALDSTWVPQWGKPVERITAAAVVNGQIHAVQRGGTDPFSSDVFVLERNGSLVRTWGRGKINSAHGAKAVNTSSGTKLFITDDGDYTIKIFDPETGAIEQTYGQANKEGTSLDPLQFGNVADVAFATGDDSMFYVVDGDGGPNNRLVAVDWATGKALWHVGGSPSSAPGLFDVPHSVAYDARRQALWIADRSNNRTQVLSAKDGSFMFEWTCFVPGGQPWAVRVDNARDSVIVADGTTGNVYIFDDSASSAASDLAAASAAPPCTPAQTIPVPPAASHLHEMAVDEATGDVYIAQVGVPTGLVRLAAAA